MIHILELLSEFKSGNSIRTVVTKKNNNSYLFNNPSYVIKNKVKVKDIIKNIMNISNIDTTFEYLEKNDKKERLSEEEISKQKKRENEKKYYNWPIISSKYLKVEDVFCDFPEYGTFNSNEKKEENKKNFSKEEECKTVLTSSKELHKNNLYDLTDEGYFKTDNFNIFYKIPKNTTNTKIIFVLAGRFEEPNNSWFPVSEYNILIIPVITKNQLISFNSQVTNLPCYLSYELINSNSDNSEKSVIARRLVVFKFWQLKSLKETKYIFVMDDNIKAIHCRDDNNLISALKRLETELEESNALALGLTNVNGKSKQPAKFFVYKNEIFERLENLGLGEKVEILLPRESEFCYPLEDYYMNGVLNALSKKNKSYISEGVINSDQIYYERSNENPNASKKNSIAENRYADNWLYLTNTDYYKNPIIKAGIEFIIESLKETYKIKKRDRNCFFEKIDEYNKKKNELKKIKINEEDTEEIAIYNSFIENPIYKKDKNELQTIELYEDCIIEAKNDLNLRLYLNMIDEQNEKKTISDIIYIANSERCLEDLKNALFIILNDLSESTKFVFITTDNCQDETFELLLKYNYGFCPIKICNSNLKKESLYYKLVPDYCIHAEPNNNKIAFILNSENLSKIENRNKITKKLNINSHSKIYLYEVEKIVEIYSADVNPNYRIQENFDI
jgi:hypothetical protein